MSGRRALHPFVVLGVALVLPGVGQVLSQQPRRGLVFVFYMVLLGVITYQVAPPDASRIGQVAGGVFVYAVSVLDAYQVAAGRRCGAPRTSAHVGGSPDVRSAIDPLS